MKLRELNSCSPSGRTYRIGIITTEDRVVISVRKRAFRVSLLTDVEDNPTDKLFSIHVRRWREVVGHMLVAGEDAGKDGLDAETACPRLNREPDEREDNALDQRKILSIDTPDVSAYNGKAFQDCQNRR